MNQYHQLLQPGEKWHCHTRSSLSEIYDCICVFEAAKRLPDCFWEDIESMHATNYSTLHNITKRFIENHYPDTVCKIKPSLSFLNWIYVNLLDNSSERLIKQKP